MTLCFLTMFKENIADIITALSKGICNPPRCRFSRNSPSIIQSIIPIYIALFVSCGLVEELELTWKERLEMLMMDSWVF